MKDREITWIFDIKYLIAAKQGRVDEYLSLPKLLIDGKGRGMIEFQPSWNQVDEYGCLF